MPVRLPPAFAFHRRMLVGSTNDEAKELAARLGAVEGTLVWADEQSGGRGRRGRQWVSPPGNLYCSLILSPDVPLMRAAELGFVAALALHDLASWAAPQASMRLKWPNDVLADRAKISGILLEALEPKGVVLGLGVNIASCPEGMAYPAAALSAWRADLTPQAALERLLPKLWDLYQLWREQGFLPIRDLWLERAKGLGEPIEVRLEDRTLAGIFTGLDEQGALILDGATRILAGDVFFPGEGYLKAVEKTLDEWNSPEDEDAWRNL
ncbi:MAG: biotin--[acetyl-CoA-carboxylase] ligase [Rhodospirillales bacterium]|nr:biotin--[acetyl-CoA-carboxylase] ligase [Rhodospirillales bacterium]